MDAKVTDPLRGALLGGRYRILGRLARGGMATVYHARDERLERTVAVKLIHPDQARDPRFLQRLGQEATTVARLSHPNVVAVYDQGSHEGSPYLVMEYVRGRTLREVISERRHLDPVEALAILEQMLAALAAAHRVGLTHRDVKPENVLVALPPNGSGDLVDAVIKVADFGLAGGVDAVSRDGRGHIMATPEYVAPELVADGRADPRADVYSAGIVLFEMITGRVPFEGPDAGRVAWQHVDHDVPPPSRVLPGLPPVVDEVVARATRRDPAHRPRDAAAMLAEVQQVREDVAALAGPTRALAHPTVVVPSMDRRPSWARLRSPADNIAARPVHVVASDAVRGAWTTVRGRVGLMRRTTRGRRQLTAVLVAIVALLVTGGWWLGFGRYTQAPQLVQLAKPTAVAEAHRLGFHLNYGAGRYSEQIPVDTVVEQHPAAGGRVVRGGTITLILSLGPERYAVPDVAGQASDIATARLREHFVVQSVNGFSDTLPINYVVGTDPPAGTPLKPRSIVKMIIAKGPNPVHVPDVVGRSLNEAEGQLRALGFEVQVQRRDDLTKPRDQVLEQNPPGGQGMGSAAGVTVVLIVANGPPGNPMPNVLNVGCNDARNQLQGLGLQVEVQGNQFEQQLGHVTDQSPQPDTPVSPGQHVSIRCGFG